MHAGIQNPLFRLISRCILLLWTAAVLYPVAWTLLGALKNNEQVMLNKPWALPELPLLWTNYSYVWKTYHFGGYFFNSAIVTTASTLLALFLSATSAYVLARFRFPGSRLLYFAYVSSMMIPIILGLIPLFFLLNDLNLINSRIGLILVYSVGALPFGIFVMTGFFKTLPAELEEAAYMDGASHYKVFFLIMLPLARPGLISIGIMNVLNIWNEYILGTVFVNDPAKYTLPVGIAVMQAEMQYRTEWGPLFAGLVLSMVPVVILYGVFQRHITAGITAGAIK